MRAAEDVAQQHRQRFLAANLAGVDVADDQADQLAGARGLGGRLHRRIGHDQQGNRSPFRRAAQLGEMSVGRRLGEITAPRGDVVVPGRRAIVAPLGDRLQRVDLAGNLTHQGKNQSDQAKDVKHHRKSLARLNQGVTVKESVPDCVELDRLPNYPTAIAKSRPANLIRHANGFWCS